MGQSFLKSKQLVISLWKKKPKDRITGINLQFAAVHLLHKNKENTSVLLKLHYVRLHAIRTILFLYFVICTHQMIYMEKPILCTPNWLVLCVSMGAWFCSSACLFGGLHILEVAFLCRFRSMQYICVGHLHPYNCIQESSQQKEPSNFRK